MSIKAILCDIEGTTTSLTFAHQILFPLSYERIESFVHTHTGLVQKEIDSVKEQISKTSVKPADQISLEEVITTLKSWIQADKKETALKSIQGKIWKESFESGQIKGHVYQDVGEYFKKWNSRGITIAIFSSGSVEAQKLIFRYSESGDLTRFVAAFFDTTTGPKKESGSYRLIAERLGLHPSKVLFLSDSIAELDAAREAGMQTVLLLREQASSPSTNSHKTAADFTEIEVDISH